jgi:hypothetical protein
MFIMSWGKKKMESFSNWRKAMQSLADRNRQRDRGFDRHAGKISRFVWPLREVWLPATVAFLCIMDFTSTYVNLALIRNPHVFERGPLAGWALRTGGFPFLLLIDLVAAATMSAVAIAVRYGYARSGLHGYGRAAFVFVLLPYAITTTVVVINNVALFLV